MNWCKVTLQGAAPKEKRGRRDQKRRSRTEARWEREKTKVDGERSLIRSSLVKNF